MYMEMIMKSARQEGYVLIDVKTGAVVGVYKTAASAYRARDRKDLAYGAVRYAVRLPY